MPLGAKLNLKDGMTLAVVARPESVTLDLGVKVDPVEGPDEADAVLAFVRRCSDLAEGRHPAIRAGSEDRIAWVAYPKAGKLDTDLNRDLLWEAVLPYGVRPVRQVSIDATWSAVRLRPGPGRSR
jgi:hypothetical protein